MWRSHETGGETSGDGGSGEHNQNRQAQTLEQRRRNAKFVKDQDARRGKPESEVKKRNKETLKSPISPFWLGILGFVVFGGLLFELISRVFF
ncbi:hypothetical protein F5B17DRAFT_429705 [Nemania serpens]|nr:hypothetical protein F5B17DRAFT_429705 [Nemania serpens]